MTTFPEALPHGEIRELYPDIFFVVGTSRPKFQGVEWQFSRNMTILREGSSLTLVNTVRLTDAGLAALDSIGKVTHVVRLGAFHGLDDPFYVERYGATLWALPGMKHDGGLETKRELSAGGPLPISDASLFVFETVTHPEAILRLDREGGILVACDSMQNWTATDEFFSEMSKEKMPELGFIRAAHVGPGWRGAANPQASDFARLKALAFRHLVPAHGTPIRDDAHAQYAATFKELFGV